MFIIAYWFIITKCAKQKNYKGIINILTPKNSMVFPWLYYNNYFIVLIFSTENTFNFYSLYKYEAPDEKVLMEYFFSIKNPSQVEFITSLMDIAFEICTHYNIVDFMSPYSFYTCILLRQRC